MDIFFHTQKYIQLISSQSPFSFTFNVYVKYSANKLFGFIRSKNTYVAHLKIELYK